MHFINCIVFFIGEILCNYFVVEGNSNSCCTTKLGISVVTLVGKLACSKKVLDIIGPTGFLLLCLNLISWLS